MGRLSSPNTRVPPHSVAAERAFLAGVFLSPDIMHSVTDILRKNDFYLPAHQVLYDAFLELYSKSVPIDIVTVSEHLQAHAMLEQAGGAVFLAELTEAVVEGAQAAHYAVIVHEHSQRRKAADACLAAAAEAYSPGSDVQAIWERLRSVADTSGAPSRPRLHCVNSSDFLGMSFPVREMLLSPIIPRQGLCMLHAMRGIGKTFIALFIAWAVAVGGIVFGRWRASQPARVLFIDGEMPARTLQERLASLMAGSDLEPPNSQYLRIVTPDMQDGPMPNLATREGQAAIEPLLEGVALIVVDNLATLARHGRANDEESWIPVQGWLLGLRRRGISVLMIHHQGKGGDQRGTSAKEDILDTVIRLDRPKDYRSEQGARFEVHLTKARGICGADVKPFEAQLFTDGPALTWITRDIEDAELEQLRQLLAEGYSYRDVAKEMDITLGKVQRLKKKLDASIPRISSSTVISNIDFSVGEEVEQ